MAEDTLPRGLTVEVENAGRPVSPEVFKAWRQRTDVALVHASEMGLFRFLTNPITASWVRPNVFPVVGDQLILRPYSYSTSGLGVELLRETSGDVWTVVIQPEDLAPVFGPSGPLAYSDEEWKQVLRGVMYSRPPASDTAEISRADGSK